MAVADSNDIAESGDASREGVAGGAGVSPQILKNSRVVQMSTSLALCKGFISQHLDALKPLARALFTEVNYKVTAVEVARFAGLVAAGFSLYYSARYLWELLPAPGDVRKKIIVITGCDSGFGHLLALRCARHGFIVFAGCLTPKGRDSLEAEAGAVVGELHAVLLDVTNEKTIRAVRTQVEARLHDGAKFWAVVNNAGVFTCNGPDEWCKLEDYQHTFDVNTLGVIRVVQTFRRLLKQYQGRVVTVSSTAARLAIPGGAPYAVSKYPLEAYMDCIRQELYHYGIKCSILEPGIFIGTELYSPNAMKERVDNAWRRLTQEERDDWGEDFKNQYVDSWNKTFHFLGTKNNSYVVDNYFHALTARYPRRRYRCGWDACFVLIPISYLPTAVARHSTSRPLQILDFIFRWTFSFNRVPVSAKAALTKYAAPISEHAEKPPVLRRRGSPVAHG